MQWIKRKDENGNTLYVEVRGRYMIDKHIVDDREFDDGYRVTHWTLHEYNPSFHFEVGNPRSGFAPVEMYPTLRDAKAVVESFEHDMSSPQGL